MPFTFSHPAIVLPLKKANKNLFSLTGLVAGSVVPDFEYFLRMKPHSIYSHEIIGVFSFDLPLGLLLCFIFHNIVRNDLFNNSPAFLRSRICAHNDFNWNRYFLSNWHIVIASIIIGSFSHILWDSFTHYDGYFVKLIPLLRTSVFDIPIYKVFQHLSTIIGGTVIFAFILRIPKGEPARNKVDKSYWILALFVAAALFCAKMFAGMSLRSYGEAVVTLISCFLISIVVVPLGRKVKNFLFYS